MRAEVERLLAADDRATNPLDHQIAGQASPLLLAGDPERHYGQVFGPYRIVRLLGQGGMGRVYLAEREGGDFTPTVALKLVGGIGTFDADLARRRFVEERRLLARLHHPHIARLLDGGVGAEAQPWFAMEYVDGAPLTEWCDAHGLSVAARLSLFAKVCDAVDHAHRFLIVHRDLKLGNVLVDADGAPKVLDFGIAKLLGEDGAPTAEASTVLMTPDYAAPEQLRGGQISTATDVYALGAVLFEVLTGRRAFRDPLAPREAPIASKAVTEDPAALSRRAAACSTTPEALRKGLRGDVDRIVRTALDPDPARRYGSASALAQDLRAVVAGQPISLRSDRAYRTGLFLRRHRLGVATAALAVIGLISTAGWALWQTRQAAARAREAIHQTQVAKREARTATSVKDLVTGLLSSASPEVALGKQLTVKEVLDNSRTTLPTTLAGEPVVAVELLTVMANSYMALEDYPAAGKLIDRALTMSDAVDAKRRASLQTSRLALALKRSDVAAEAVAAAALRLVLPEVRDPDTRVDALLVLADHALTQYKGDLRTASLPLTEARATLPPSDIRRVKAATMLADWYLSTPEEKTGDSGLGLMSQTLVEARPYFPLQHPDLLNLREMIGYAYKRTRQYDKAIALLRQSLRDSTTVCRRTRRTRSGRYTSLRFCTWPSINRR